MPCPLGACWQEPVMGGGERPASGLTSAGAPETAAGETLVLPFQVLMQAVPAAATLLAAMLPFQT